MTLFSAPTDPWSHRTRIVLAEKGISIEIVSVEPGRFPEDLLDLNPYHSVPTLVDRELVLYDSRVIIEYLDERFPHPPLMPVDPVTRAQFRLALYRIERDWYGLVQQIEQEPPGVPATYTWAVDMLPPTGFSWTQICPSGGAQMSFSLDYTATASSLDVYEDVGFGIWAFTYAKR